MTLGYIDVSIEKEKLLLEYPQPSSEFTLLEKVNHTISKQDDMYAGNAAHYFKVGLSAIKCIDDSISNANSPRINDILDMPCGYGRVLRFLCQRFPDAYITGMDIAESGVNFCMRTFGVKGIYSKKKLDLLALGEKFDLIWCGSLLTHISELFAHDLLQFFNGHLSIGGLLIFSSHGKFVWEVIKYRNNTYGLDDAGLSQLIRSFTESGYGYANYPGQADYGISVTTAGWLQGQFDRIPGWKLIYSKERGWDNHQDVYCILKSC